MNDNIVKIMHSGNATCFVASKEELSQRISDHVVELKEKWRKENGWRKFPDMRIQITYRGFNAYVLWKSDSISWSVIIEEFYPDGAHNARKPMKTSYDSPSSAVDDAISIIDDSLLCYDLYGSSGLSTFGRESTARIKATLRAP